MKKKHLLPLCCIIIVLLVCLAPTAHAEDSLQSELFEKSGAENIYDSLDDDTKQLLSDIGINGTAEQADTESLFSMLSSLLKERLSQPLRALASLIAVIILCRLAASLDDNKTTLAADFAGALACAAVIVTPLLKLIESTGRAVDGASVFLLASVPVYGALMAAGGSAAAGASYSFLALAAGNAIPILSSVLIIPLLRVFLALALVSSVSQVKFGRFAASLYSFAKWLLVLCVTAFSGILSVQTMLNAQVDAAGNKTVKLIASSAIPIVGSAFGDAIAAIQNSVQIVKSGVGAFGMLAALCIFAPIAIEASLWSAVCFLGQTAADLFEQSRLSSFLGMCASAARMILAVIAAACAVSLVTAAVVLFVKAQT